jgi:outer membrane lipoprotein SlyB
MNRTMLVTILLLAVGLGTANAADSKSTADAYTAAKKAATTRYAEDKKLCADESSSSARMQCLRDAKAEYTKALAEAKKEKDAGSKSAGGEPVCADCGKVLSVKAGEKEGKGGPVGIIGGGVAGAVLGHQVGGGTGKDLATIAGAAGGAYAGHKIEQKMTATKYWAVRVKFDDGKERTYTFDHDPAFAAGDAVKASKGTIVRR